jgi:hypothetical protein
MNVSAVSNISDELRRIVMEPTCGIVGLVDELLAACARYDLHLDWNAERCRIRCGEGKWEELTGMILRKSVFRAILARIAALCNERVQNSVSPYGGEGELDLASDPCAIVAVTFSNTLTEQKLSLTNKSTGLTGHQHEAGLTARVRWPAAAATRPPDPLDRPSTQTGR